jgi:hypothetical protein
MKKISKHLNPILVLGAALLWGPAAKGQVIGQWDFNSSNLVQSAGSTVGDLQFADGTGGVTQTGTTFGTTTSFGIPDINGTAATVMQFIAATNGQGYQMPPIPTANSGGVLVNAWTLIMDLLYPTASDAKDRPIIDTDGQLTSGGGFVAGPDFSVSASDGIGAPAGPYFGNVKPNTWYRIGMVATTNQVSFYLNGARVGTIAGSGLDGRFALSTTQPYLILSTILDAAAVGYVNSIQIRDVALNAGQMQALGAPTAAGVPQTVPPVPAFIDSSSPAAGATGVTPEPNITVVLNQGDTTVDASSIKLLFDGALFPSSLAATPPTFTVTASVTNFLDPNSTHSLSLIWSDSVAGKTTNTWSFTVVAYQNITLPTPFYLETFDGLAENVSGPGPLPVGWTVTNQTWPEDGHAGFNLDDLKSDSYADWVLITAAREFSWAGAPVNEPADRTDLPPIVLNGQLLTISNFLSGNLMWAESDQRCGGCWGQYQEMHTADIDCTSRTNVFIAFHSFYEQNQDNMNLVEYSIDQGTNWLPVRYLFCTQGNGESSDIYYTNNAAGNPVIDIDPTFNKVDANRSWAPWPAGCTNTTDCPPHGTNYGYYVNAPITTNLIPFIGGYTNDDTKSSKEIVVVRLAKADGQKTVRFRFVDTGTSSWFWGIDNLGLYEINTPVINTQPQSQTIDAGTPVTFTVVASSIKPLSYQWEFGGINIASATNSSYTIPSVGPGDAGQYKVIVKNADGSTPSAPATLTVNTTPQFVTQPYSQVAYVNSSVSFNAVVSGGRPMSLQWYHDGTQVNGATSQTLTINSVQTSDQGNYTLIISNSFGTNTSVAANLSVYSGSITGSLVAHLKFDGDYKDASGSGADGSAVGTPSFQTGIIGQAVHLTSSGSPANNPDTNNYVTFGTATQLQFGTNNFSFSFWSKIAFQNDDKPFISNKDWGSGGNQGWVLATEGSGMKWNFKDNVSGRRDSPTVAPQLEDGNWHHVVVTFLRSSIGSIYVDGQLVNVANVAPSAGNAIGSSDSTLAVNVGQDGTGHYTDDTSGAALDMLMDDLGIWQRTLTASEASAIYSAGKAGKDLSQSVVSSTPAQPVLTVTVSGNSLHFSWPATPTGRLQTSAALNPTGWSDVPGTTGVGSATVPISGSKGFFRVAQ